ncbi:hybrid sensor histidine kinase/response regulator transcription factor [Marinicella rhabdoformis]|uniref:hybrid sensor histidine kinase/response regulator transcription factor n=1 Tax=Marinicella rhabdoformis TaxID=2580566 RepID=UPI0012AED707|nr:response regulator [Marinicella rhabdoformis]
MQAENYAEIGLPVVEVYDSFVHKGANQNWWLAQTKNGLIYNGSGTGLNEWDGEQWRMYHTPFKSRIRAVSIWTDERIYVGTNNDIAYYHANESGSLVYQSLLSDWPSAEKQFGEVWSVASNKHGVMFLTSQSLMFWDGVKIHKIDTLFGSHRIFNVDDVFYFKTTSDPHLYTINVQPDIEIKKTGIQLDEKISLRKVLRNPQGNLVLFTAINGIYEIIDNQVVQRLEPQYLPDEVNVFNAFQASDGYYYLTSLFHGLFIVSPEFKLVKHYRQEHGLGTNTLLSVMEDFQQNIWISGVPNIIKMVPPHRFSRYETEDKSNLSEGISLINNRVITFGEGVYELQIGASAVNPASFIPVTDHKNNIWDTIEYKGHLLFSGTGGVFALLNTEGGGYANKTQLLETQFAKHLAIDEATDTLFASSAEGLFRIHYNNNQWQVDKIPGTDNDLHFMAIDEGIVWVGTATQALYKIEHAQDDTRANIITEFDGNDGLGKNNVVPFVISQGMVFGTNDGLMDYQQGRQPELQFIETLPDIFHSPNKDVYRVYEDQQQMLWYRIAAHTGYASLDQNNQWQTHEHLFKYFPDSGYKDFIKTAENVLWFSMANGNIFRSNTDLIKSIPPQGKLNIRQIINLDTEEQIYGGLGTPHLTELTQDNNSIRIQFAMADNSISNAKDGNQVLYRHRLLGSGVDKFSKWSAENSKDFTLLKGGEYQFEVQAKDAWDRVSSSHIDYHVLPPWYLTKTAWLIYASIGLLLLVLCSWITQKWRTQRLRLRNEELVQQVSQRTAEVQAQANKLKQQQILKDRFFTNVSHEFRTPLTLTIAPLEAFLNDNKDMDNTVLHPIRTALRNSKTMLSLVCQVLDLNRLESGQFQLKVARYDVADLILGAIEKFQPWAQQHQQELTAVYSDEPCWLYFDKDLIDKCLSNLISNAIKYSGDKTRIEVSLVKSGEYTGIKVDDNGRGINPEFENKLFQRFSQDEASEQISEPGTGIGLALVKELIVLHHGHVELVNHSAQLTENRCLNMDINKSTGCAFILWLHNDQGVFNASQIVEPIALEAGFDADKVKLPPVISEVNDKESEAGEDITSILIVDDNQELRAFIAARLSTYYRIIEAENGQQGISMATLNLPDLIISDVMMPVMDGLQMVKELKNNKSTQNIPVIILTAKSTKRETVEGLQVGADDYLSKPFDTSELIVRIAGIINSRKQIRAAIKQELTQQFAGLKNCDEFVDKLKGEILSGLSDTSLSVESLSAVMGMSRSSLNRKCQQELNKSTGQIITQFRMQQAHSLLSSRQYTVSEVAYGTGFDSLAYFSRTFKKHFGKTPSEICKPKLS